jgi:hypothetical protein
MTGHEKALYTIIALLVGLLLLTFVRNDAPVPTVQGTWIGTSPIDDKSPQP